MSIWDSACWGPPPGKEWAVTRLISFSVVNQYRIMQLMTGLTLGQGKPSLLPSADDFVKVLKLSLGSLLELRTRSSYIIGLPLSNASANPLWGAEEELWMYGEVMWGIASLDIGSELHGGCWVAQCDRPIVKQNNLRQDGNRNSFPRPWRGNLCWRLRGRVLARRLC